MHNIASLFNCQVVWWDAKEIRGVFTPLNVPVPSLDHLKRLLPFSHPVAITRGRHSLCTGCPDERLCTWHCEFFVPFRLWNEEMGIGWQFAAPTPFVDNPSWLKFAVDITSLLISALEQEKSWSWGELFRQTVELCGQMLGEGLILFDERWEVVYQNEIANELNLYRQFREGTGINKLFQNKKETELVLNNSLPLRFRPFYYGRDYLGGAVFTRREKREFKSGVFQSREPIGLPKIIGKNPKLVKAISIAQQVALTDSTILLRGESGTGKEMFARAIHENSPRKKGPFIAINCAAIPENLLESELFGYEEGSFTGARRGGKPGKIELAHKGTLFLDEIGDMPPALQAKLLRVLQEKKIERVGGTRPVPIDVRIIAATHRNLEEMIATGQFREDLYYRLSVIPIYIPPLRERPEDIELLLYYYVKKYCVLLNKEFKTFTYDALQLLKAYPWPGNIRELENTVEYIVTVEDKEEIGVESLPLAIRRFYQPQSSPERKDIRTGRVKREELAELLERFGYSVEGKKELARHLGISLATLYRWLKKYKL
ncbi:sigma-54 interaction domain-containing protein [Thermanaeromonas toyohensis]|uniref:sigma-54 interaction domain-containing protein n=1 Tax=Thermanaeromonas toyohensis TaxID=161154 RepID=UPI0018D296B9|nr:sigma 54-interacting transcriptional regulator [Thermanaeromonas toyohensis]